MRFIFVDETGDPGRDSKTGASPFFGMAALSILDKDYYSLRSLISQVHWLCGTATEIELTGHYVRAANLLRGLKTLAENAIVVASGLFIIKNEYNGRYLNWAESHVLPQEWAYYLRNYILRHLLEFHFASSNNLGEPVDLILDRVLLSESQRKNTLNYLNSKTTIPLNEPFRIPQISFLTLADSKYVGGLEIAHVLADVVRDTLKGKISEDIAAVADFIQVQNFSGSKSRDSRILFEGYRPPQRSDL